MPSLADVLNYADYLHVAPLAINQDRCVAVRNRNSSCRKCVEACLTHAISVDSNEVTLDAEACVNCGVCTSVCPTHALSSEEPQSGAVLAAAREVGNVSLGLIVVACARAAATHQADSTKIVEVPCLGHVSDELLVSLAGQGLDDVVLVDGNCHTCKYGKADHFIDLSVQTARVMIDAVDGSALITRSSAFPEEVQGSSYGSTRGEDRRGLFSKTGSYVKRVAGQAAQKTVEEKLGIASEPRTLKERLGAGKSGRMPSFEPTENFELLDNLEALASHPDELASSGAVLTCRRFGTIELDTDPCSGCGLCVLFCPTEALAYTSYDVPPDDKFKYIEFSPCLCTQCNLCADVCMRDCLRVLPEVSVAQLYDFEPQLIEMKQPENKFSIFDYKKD